MRREWEAQRGALATVRRFNAILSVKGYVWFWPKIAAGEAYSPKVINQVPWLI
jgi:hypothetical protein